MKVCMIVFNNVTKDHRVLREAETLQAAGHDVHVVGIPDAAAMEPVLVLESGVTVHRVQCQANAYDSLIRSAALRILPIFIVMLVVAWGVIGLTHRLLAGTAGLGQRWHEIVVAIAPIGTMTWLDWSRAATYGVVVLVFLYLAGRLTSGYFEALGARTRMKKCEREMALRYADGLFDSKLFGVDEFPMYRPRIPDWVPESLLELMLEPMDWLGGRSGRFVLYRYRARETANLVARIKPDVVHAHDCMALPAGVLAKEMLEVPLVYDAHEVYEAAASRRIGVVDYYTRVHRKYLRYVDRFITINQSAARFYRYAYPFLPPAVVIRNACYSHEPVDYDGRLHDAAGIPRSQKILLYQGGFTAERGLPTIVRTAPYLPDDWTLVLMGWGPLNGELHHLAALDQQRYRAETGFDVPVTRTARFVPGVKHEDLPLWTAGATVGVIPYENTVFNHWICSPNKLWEFPTAGVPIIVQPFPELRAVVETYGCGWVLPPDLTPGTVADLVSSLTGEMIAEARAGCKRFIVDDAWDAVYAARLIRMYSDIKPQSSQVSPIRRRAPAGA